ncbi:hypothetical protein PHBOTO_001651 [Pseudozyma hubeiensis]|nr:hypothetical protein PHBOTO_001651 [Pseudozyma hubeiensis]
MTRSTTRKAALLCMYLATAFNFIADTAVNAAVIPRMAPLKVTPMEGDVLTAPTPLPIVATYVLYFGNNGATTTPPSFSPTSTRSTSSAPTSTSSPARSTTKAGKCTKKKTTAVPSSSASASASVRANVAPSASTTSTVLQQNTVFPTVAPARWTASTKQRASINAEVLPHNFVNKVDDLVETFQGMTGRKARQLALILSNQTDVVANTSKTNTILSNLAEAYPSNNTTAAESSSSISNSSTTSTPSSALKSTLPKQYIIATGQSNITLFSNTANYGPNEVRHDLHVIRRWAGDLGQLSTRALLDETTAAILSASSRYFPELSTRDAARVIMADIKAESDFDPTVVSGGRLDSGSSWGLMQVSPFGSGELALFQQHVTVDSNTFSWTGRDNTTSWVDAGPLLDWNTGKTLQVSKLTTEDLFRPWVNIHIATWIQSNLARTSSQDPYTWPQISAKSATARSSSAKTSAGAWLAVDRSLVGAKLPRSYLTGLGSWVAGPAVDGYGSYTQAGDDVSKPYFNNIADGLSVLYNTTMTTAWMNSLTLHPGLVDFH